MGINSLSKIKYQYSFGHSYHRRKAVFIGASHCIAEYKSFSWIFLWFLSETVVENLKGLIFQIKYYILYIN